MGTATVGTIGLNMVLNSAGFRRSLQNVQSQANTAGTRISNSFKKIGTAIAAAFSAKMIASFGKSCMDLGSDLAEVQNVVDVTFTSMSDSVNKWSQNAAKSYGLSETMAKKYVGLYGTMSRQFGFTEEQAYNMSTALAGLSGDVASYYNITQDEAYTKLKSVFSGETETLKDIGIVMTQNALDAYALANGYRKTTSEMTESEKVALRYNFILNQLNNVSGDFSRTQDSWANQTRILKLNFDSLKASIGQGLITAFTPLLKMLNQLVEKAKELSSTFSNSMSSLFGSTSANNSSAAGTAVEALTTDANNSAQALDAVTESSEKAKRSVAGFDKLNIISQDTSATNNNSNNDNSTAASNGKSSPLVTAMDNLASSWGAKSQKLIDSVKGTMGKIKTAISEVGSSWNRVWSNGAGQKFLDNIKNLVSDIINNVGFIADGFTKAWNKAGLGDSVIQSFIDKANSLIDLIDVIAVDFGKVWNNGAGERIWGNILSTIRNCNNATKTLRDKIKEAWDKNDTGKKIWQDVLGIVEDITGFMEEMSAIRLEWLENLDLSPITESVEKLGGAFRELLQACGDKLKTAYKNILLPLAKWTIEKGVPKLVEMLADALKAVSNVIKNISDKTLYAIAGGIGAIGTAVIIFKTGTAIASGIDKVSGAIKSIGSIISANPLLAIASAIGGIVLAVKSYNELVWSNSEAKKFCDEINSVAEELQLTTDSIEQNLSDSLVAIDETFAENTLIDKYQQKLNELLEKATLTPEEQANLDTIVSYFTDHVEGFEEAWNNYVDKSKEGSGNVTNDLKLIQEEINNTIDSYQKLAWQSAIQDLYSSNVKEQILAKQDVKKLNDELGDYAEQLSDLSLYQAYQEIVDMNGTSSLDKSQLKEYNSLVQKYGKYTVNELKRQNAELEKSYSNAESQLQNAVSAQTELKMVSEDYLDVLGVLKGDYSDAAAVMMAYKEGMISLEDIQKSEWKTADNLEKAAIESGKNMNLGLVEGTEEYADRVSNAMHSLGAQAVGAYKNELGIQSPSKVMYKQGEYTIAGLVNAISDNTKRVQTVISEMVRKIKTALEPIKSVFTSVFSGIAAVVRNPLNTMMSMLERFVNGFVSAINGLATGADWAINNIGQIFGQEWHIGRLNKITLPRFAKGAIVKAPTLAVVGDNAGANTGNPEVIAPLNKLQQMIDTSSGQDVVILSQILDYLKRIYEMFVVFRNNGGNIYEFVAKLNGSTLFDEMIKQNEMYKRRHNGKSAFA